MSAPRGLMFVGLGAAAAGLLVGAVYKPADGLLTAAFLIGSGIPSIAAAHLLVRRRRAAGPLARQFALGVGLTVGLVTLGMVAVVLLMFISPHDALLMTLLLAFSGGLIAYSNWVLARGAMEDIESIRDGLGSVGEGRRDPTIRTGARDELHELAGATNQMIEQLAEREGQRDASEHARRSLVAAVSHDLRTPLTSLRLLGEAVEDDLVDEETRRRYLAQMSVHVRSLSALIEDLFELSRLEAGDIQWSMQQVRLDALVEETVEAMRAHGDAKSVTVEASVPDGLAADRANPEKLQRVLFNLIQNAIRHTPPDGSVTVAAEQNGRGIEVEVADTGEGLATDERDRAFEPFYRGGRSQARPSDGSGLGLTICRAIVEAHGGEIWFVEGDAGTRVRFSLPQAR